MKKLILAAIIAVSSASVNAETYRIIVGADRYEVENNLPFIQVQKFVNRLYPEIDDKQIIVDLIDGNLWHVTIVLSQSTKQFNVELIDNMEPAE